GAKQNVTFLAASDPKLKYALREKYMLENMQWIMNREAGKGIMLFAHLAHLSKDFYVLNSAGKNVMKKPMFGDYLGRQFKQDYKVIANVYCELIYPDGTDSVKSASFPVMLRNQYAAEQFYMQV